MKQVKAGKSYYGQHFSKTLPRIEYLPEEMTMLEVKKMIYNQIKCIYKEEFKDDSEINRNIILHIYDNLPMEQEGKYTKRKALCEFCKDKHGSADTCDIKINKVSANSEEGCKEI